MSTTEILNSPEVGQPIHDEVIDANLGHIALSEILNDTNESLRDIELGGEHYATDLPEGIDPFEHEETGRLDDQPLLPSSLDQLPLGNFKVSKTSTNWEGRSHEDKKSINVHSGRYGKMVDREAFTKMWDFVAGTDQLMSRLGYELGDVEGEGHGISSVPTPETAVAALADAGVDIKLFPDTEHIKGPDYLATFAEGKYPVSTKTESMYSHDIGDDHLTTMVLGGEPLKTALQEVAKSALQGDTEAIDNAAFNIDVFTASLRAVIAVHPQLQGEAYGKQRGRYTLLKIGSGLGVSPDTVNNILSTAQDNARNLGIDVRELD